VNEATHEIDGKRPTERRLPVVAAIIPCLDEEAAIGQVVTAVLAQNVSEVVVVDGGSRDRTAERAESAGARVIVEPRRGYGRAIQAGIAAVRDDTAILLFLDGDGSDPTEFISDLVSPIMAGEAVFVLGSRVRGSASPAAFRGNRSSRPMSRGVFCASSMVQASPICRRSAQSDGMHSSVSA
jgi:glycosyltransferase involved in cell wall biosynthesis